MTSAVIDERGTGKRIKSILRPGLFRAATVLFNAALRWVPFELKYAIGGALRRRRAPYRFLGDGDTVVQIGSARDVLDAGRSRAIHFARIVHRGRVIVIEADAESCRRLREVVERRRLRNLTVVEGGAWDRKQRLRFLSSASHPAANLVEEAKEVGAGEYEKRGYEPHEIDVDTVDAILDRVGASAPSLVSVTTNGAELKILEGMAETIARGCPYISLASTRDGLIEEMTRRGYELAARDDRGYCFRKVG